MDNETRRILIAETILALAGAAALLHAVTGEGRAHQAPSGWAYPTECCSGIDCAEIPASAVKETQRGYQVTLRAGQHQMVKDGVHDFLVPYKAARAAPDGVYHICLSPALKVLCFFAGPRGA